MSPLRSLAAVATLSFVAIAARADTVPTDEATAPAPTSKEQPMSVLTTTVQSIEGKDVPLSQYEGKVLLIVNVASECGYTPQYDGLQKLHEKYSGKGFAVLGFPANEFGAQEPGSDEEIRSFCSTKYDVTFDMFGKVVVKGQGIHPLFAALTGETGSDISWNFGKFLIGKDGQVVGRFDRLD